MPNPGELLANTYQIVNEIGKGGLGIIYLAYHINLQKYVVVKKIKDNFTGTLNARGEVDILKQLHHTNLPQVYDFIQIGNDIYTVMEYIEGHDLKYYIDNGYSLPDELLCVWFEQLLGVLDYLHNHGILHLDIKPANIMVTPENNVVLIDFNISLTDDDESLMGISMVYASPEQYCKWEGVMGNTRGRYITLDAGTDLYSLGGCFYQLMTGYPPSPVPGDMIPIKSFILGYDAGMVEIISEMLEYDRDKRISSAAKALNKFRRLQRTKAEKYTLRIVSGILTTAIAVLVVVFGIVLYRNNNAADDADKIAAVTESERKLAEYNKLGEYRNAYEAGMDFAYEYEEELDTVEGLKPDYLEHMADACMGMEDYTLAKKYIDELLNINDTADICYKASIIYANIGEYDVAEQYIGRASEKGGDSSMIEKSKAELMAAKGDYVGAISGYRRIIEKNNAPSDIRRLASLNLIAGSRTENDALKSKKYISDAIKYYEDLAADKEATYSDKMNLATAYGLCDMNKKALSVLEGLAVDFPDQYEVFLQMALIQYNSENKKPAYDRDYSKAKYNVKKADSIFRSKKYGSEDERLDNLMDVLASIPE